jgi:hypothetical protein
VVVESFTWRRSMMAVDEDAVDDDGTRPEGVKARKISMRIHFFVMVTLSPVSINTDGLASSHGQFVPQLLSVLLLYTINTSTGFGNDSRRRESPLIVVRFPNIRILAQMSS